MRLKWMSTESSNHTVEAIRRLAAPRGAGFQFGLPFSAPPHFPAAVPHLWRSAAKETVEVSVPGGVSP